MKLSERLALMNALLNDLAKQIKGDRNNCAHVGPRALNARIDHVLEVVDALQHHVHLCRADTLELEEARESENVEALIESHVRFCQSMTGKRCPHKIALEATGGDTDGRH